MSDTEIQREKSTENNGDMEVCQENADNSESNMEVSDDKAEYEKVENVCPTDDNHAGSREEEFFSKLGLTKYMERNDKISLLEVMSQSLGKINSMNDIPWYVLLKMLMLDYRGRDDIISAAIKSSFESDQIIQKPEKDFMDDCEEMFSEMADNGSPDNLFSLPHPMDVLIAVILCSSNLLRQILYEKLFMCKLSIPLIIPSVLREESIFLLWSLRSTVAEFRLPGGSLSETSVVEPCIPIVSCLRVGEISRSKSKFLNEILNDQSHPTFFHRDCLNGMNTRVLSEGTIEIAWYFPSQQPENTDLSKNLILLNLRGDGKSAKTAKSVEFLCKISSIVLVMIDINVVGNSDNIDSIRTKLSEDTKLILLFTKQPSTKFDEISKERIKKFVESLNHKGIQHSIIFDFDVRGEKNIKDLKNKTITVLEKNLTERTEEMSIIDCMEVANSLEIRVDENTSGCTGSKKLASSLVEEISKSGICNLKTKNLPLQCRPWEEWAKLHTEEHRREKRGNQNMESYLDKISNDMRKLRQEQLQLLEKPNILCDVFLNNLSEPVSEESLYFLKWLKLFLDNISRQTLPNLQKECSKKWNEIRQCEDVTKQTALQLELYKCEKELAESSFGLEHFMRELAQAYESVCYTGKEASDKTSEQIQCLPSIMAELMLLGYPLEIMDGDAAHIPMKWVQAVLAQVSKRIGNKKIFVLSVLGIQSSGKSTLLNTMFGLQFAVSAGRCTRGVFAQLLPVCSEYSGTSYDYILVVDTEGLRAAELGKEKIQHDNEIATLVIGLGDTTIVNVKGENVSEMEDVLEIVVHALLKMSLVNKNLKLQPSCLFIHQNVSAQDASQKLRVGQQKFIETLDKVTKAAGKQEDNPQYTRFKQLIDFDINKDIWYIPDLWKGDPPMAPVNPGYSENINNVKQKLMTDIMHKRSLHLTTDKFCSRLKDLWHGILDQNFVFSFKNSLEMEAYNSLESELTDNLWSMKSTGMEWFNSKRNVIGNSENNLGKLCLDLLSECRQHLGNAFQSAEEKLDNFFKTNEDRSFLEQWRANSTLRLKTSYSNILGSITDNIRCEIEKRKIQVEQKKVMKTYLSTTMKDAQRLAEELRQQDGQQKLCEEELKLKFREKWNEWMKDVPQKEKEDLNVVEKISDTLERHFQQEHALLKTFQKERCQETAFENCVEAVESYCSEKIQLSWNRFRHILYKHSDIVLKYINEMMENVKGIVSEHHYLINQDQRAKKIKVCVCETVKKLITVLTFTNVDELRICLTIFSFQYASYPYSRVSTFEPGQGKDHEMVAYGIRPAFEQALLNEFPCTKEVMRKLKPKFMQQISGRNFHFDIKKHTQKTEGKSVNVKEHVQKLLDNLFDEVESYTAKVQCFQDLYIEEIIHMMTVMESKCNDVSFTKTFRIQLAVYLCHFSLPKFCEKQKRYVEDRDQRFVYERDNYGPCFERFKNFYFKFTDEQALANVLSERVGIGVENAVNLDLARLLADDVRHNVSQLQLKPTFLKSVLHQLLEVDKFEEFYLYLNDYYASTEKWLCYYIDKYLFAEQTNGPNRYTQIANLKIECLISEVCKEIVGQISNNENSLPLWIKDFHARVKDKLELPEDDLLSLSDGYEIVSLETFSEHFKKSVSEHLNKIQTIFSTHTPNDHTVAHEDNVYKLMAAECKGCTERCPFCSAPCSLSIPGHAKDDIPHSAVEHYPQACGKYRWNDSAKLVTENCTVMVAGNAMFCNSETNGEYHPYNDYKKIYPDWDIHGDVSVEATPYWKWFLVKYEAQLAEISGAERPSIPPSWKTFTKEDAMKPLRT